MTRSETKHIAGFLRGVLAVAALATAVAVISSVPALAETGEFEDTAPLQIPAAKPCCAAKAASIYPSSIDVSGMHGIQTEVTVTLHGVSHENLQDLAVLLVGPGGSRGVILMASYERGSASYTVSNATPTFGDQGEIVECSLREGLLPTFPYERKYEPFNCGLAAPFPVPAPKEPYGYSLEAEETNGIWSLYVDDDLGEQEGSIAGGWSLHIHTLGVLPPTNYALPSISGTGQVGQTLLCSKGSWMEWFYSSFSYQWLRDGSNIGGATGSSYVVQAADQGHTLTCEVTASNSAGHQAATSAGVAIPAGSPGGDFSGGGGVLGSRTVVVSSARIAALLAGQLLPSGKAAKIAMLLKSGWFTVVFKALEAGTAVIDWYEVPVGAKLAKKVKPKPALVAAGQYRFSAAGTATIKIKLTGAGKRLLKRARQLKLTARGTFTPTGGAPITAMRTFVLRR